jgi:hypothetical protein
LLKLGTVSVDGTKIAALAAKKRTLRREQLAAQLQQLQGQVDALLAQAEEADGRGVDEGTTLPQELANRQRRLERLRTAQAVLAQREGSDAVNPSDPDSGLTPTAQGPFLQGYNAQAAVSAEGPTLIVGAGVVQATNDRQQLAPTVAAIPSALGQPDIVLADTGYDHHAQIEQLNQRGIRVHCPPQNVGAKPPRDRQRLSAWQDRRRRREAFNQPEVQKLYRRRAATSEPCFHVIKRLMGFSRFSLRGLQAVNLEWDLVALAYNCRKIAPLWP